MALIENNDLHSVLINMLEIDAGMSYFSLDVSSGMSHNDLTLIQHQFI